MQRYLKSLPLTATILVTSILATPICLADESSDGGNDKPRKSEALLSGRIVDNLGKPVTDASLLVFGPTQHTAKTDDDGFYEIPEIKKPGRYRIKVESQRCVGVIRQDKRPEILIDGEKPIIKNFTLQRACRMKVHVQDDDGKPVRAMVYGKLAEPDQSTETLRQFTRGGTTTLGGIPPKSGKYLISVVSESHVPARLVVEANDPEIVSEHTVIVKKGQTVSGTVMCSDGLPAAGWKLSATPAWWNFNYSMTSHAIDEDGSFKLPNIIDGEYTLTVEMKIGTQISFRRVLTSAKLTEMPQPIAVTMDQPSLKSMVYADCKIRWIGKPLDSGFNISAYCFDTKRHVDFYVKPGVTKIKLGPMPKGIYRLRPEHRAIEVMNLRKVKNLEDLANVSVPTKKPIQIVLHVRGQPHVQAAVIDAKSKKPVTKYQYQIKKIRTLEGPNYVQNDEWNPVNDDKGQFQADVVGPGIYDISVQAKGYGQQTSQQVNTIESPDKVLPIELVPELHMTGTVVDEDGSPIHDAKVRALSLSRGSMQRFNDSRFYTDQGAVNTDQGKFVLRGLAAGYESIRVDHPDFAFTTIRTNIKADAETLRIELKRGATVQGHVYDGNGKPQANVTLDFYDDSGYNGSDEEAAGRYGRATSDNRGFYRLDHLPATQIYVMRKDGYGDPGVYRHVIFCEDGRTHTLNFGGANQVAGQLLANGEPLQNAKLQITGADPTFGAMKAFSQTDQEGRFRFFGVPPGHWTLYRTLADGKGEWVKLRQFDAPPDADLTLDTISQTIGSLTVVCTTTATALPEDLRLTLVSPRRRNHISRDVATLDARNKLDDPFQFQGVTAGRVDLLCKTNAFEFIKPLDLSADDIGSTIQLSLPSGTASVTAILSTDRGPLGTTAYLQSADGLFRKRINPERLDDGTSQYVSRNLPPGQYQFVPYFARQPRPWIEFKLDDGEQKKLDEKIDISGTATVGQMAFRVTDDNGVYLPVKASFPDHVGIEVHQTLQFCNLRLSGLMGKRMVVLDHPGFEPIRSEFEFINGRGTSTPIRLKRTQKSRQ